MNYTDPVYNQGTTGIYLHPDKAFPQVVADVTTLSEAELQNYLDSPYWDVHAVRFLKTWFADPAIDVWGTAAWNDQVFIPSRVEIETLANWEDFNWVQRMDFRVHQYPLPHYSYLLASTGWRFFIKNREEIWHADPTRNSYMAFLSLWLTTMSPFLNSQLIWSPLTAEVPFLRDAQAIAEQPSKTKYLTTFDSTFHQVDTLGELQAIYAELEAKKNDMPIGINRHLRWMIKEVFRDGEN
jgi:hypothetical protein